MFTVVFVQSLSHVQLFVTPACQAPLSFTVSQSLLRLMSVELVMPSNDLILCHPLLFLPSIFPSIRVFSSELAFHIRWPNYWSFRFSINPSSVCSGLISFQIGWFDLLAVQRTLKSLLQHHNLKASVFQCPAICMVQTSYPYMTPGKTIALSIWPLLAKWCLCFSVCCLGLSRWQIFPCRNQWNPEHRASHDGPLSGTENRRAYGTQNSLGPFWSFSCSDKFCHLTRH